MKLYNSQYFINKFNKIPHYKWNISLLINKGKCCGYCKSDTIFSKELNDLDNLFKEHIGFSIVTVNNGHTNKYVQHTQKDRVLAALYDIQKLGG